MEARERPLAPPCATLPPPMPQTTEPITEHKKPQLKPKMTPEFLKEYARLNPNQKKAVDSIEGPVMVVAGPGTGKTQTLAMRAANILARTQMRPYNILCLTFSTSGAKAMRERLREIIGPDAYGITIETVHSFCNQIILEHPHLFEDFRALEQVSEIERLRIVRKGMSELKPGSILGRPSLENDRASAILNRISEMKREGISTEDLEKIIPEFKAEIELTEAGKARNKETQAYKDDLRLVKQLEEFITLYRGYEEALKESHRYDYEDMVLVCHKALVKHDWLLASLQEKYQYVLVDEFQDLNGSQYDVIDTLTKNPIEDEDPNIFVVGDDDQAIYRFQGASPQNMMRFLKRFPELEIITLTANYRSTQEILDAAADVIENNEERLDSVNKRLESNIDQKSFRNSESGFRIPIFLRFPAIENERAGIAQILKDANENGTEWNEMAVLCRRNEELAEMHDALHAAGIPVVLAAKQNLMMHREVRQAIIILKSIEHINDNAALSAALSCTTLGCHPAELGRLWCAFRRVRREERLSLREYLLANHEELPSSIKNAYDLIEALHAKKDSVTLPELMETLLKDSKLLPAKDDTEADPRVIAGLHAFYDYVKDRVYENKALKLPELLSDLDQYLTEKHLKLEYAVPHIVTDGVQLMTAHGAKGLEFELVIIAHTRHKNWGNRMRGKMMSLPDHLIFGIDKKVEKRAKQEDERRLMYVAMTRAKRHLILTFPETYRSGEKLQDAQPSSFIAEAGDKLSEQKIPASDVPAPVETLHMPGIEIDEAFRAFLKERLEEFRMSVTALNAYLRDPQEFLWLHLLSQPQAKAAHLSYGTVVHAALEKRNLAWQAGEEFEVDELINTFEKTMTEREVFTEKEREHYLHAGKEVLMRYASETSDEHPIILSAERSITARLDDIPLYGKVDRIDLFSPEGQNCRVIDYKTGMPKKTENAVRKSEDLFRQLVFYKLLCDLSPSFTHTATKFTLDFVGTQKEGRRVIDMEIKEEEVKELKEIIKAIWTKITAMDFSPIA